MDLLLACDVALQRDEMLATLPAVLDFARVAVIATFGPEDDEARALTMLIEECAVSAHRLALRERLRMAGCPIPPVK